MLWLEIKMTGLSAKLKQDNQVLTSEYKGLNKQKASIKWQCNQRIVAAINITFMLDLIHGLIFSPTNKCYSHKNVEEKKSQRSKCLSLTNHSSKFKEYSFPNNTQLFINDKEKHKASCLQSLIQQIHES